MLQVLSSAWALLFGLGLLMVGNGLQGTILGVRGDLEGFSTFEMSLVMSAYFVGFLGGSRMAPDMIRRVGHVRVFAALATLISAVMILYPALTHPAWWIAGRAIIGFCFSGVYVTAESWLNNAADNENRGKALSLYMIVMMLGVVISQALVVVADPSGYVSFVIASVIVSVAVTPILLSISPTPAFQTAKPMSLARLMKVSPLGCVGMFLSGGIFAAQFGMGAVYGAAAGLTLGQISAFVGTFYVGAMTLQYPLGWLSDRMDRRALIMGVAALGAVASFVGMTLGGTYVMLLISAYVIGGTTNPLYSMLLAHTNDYLDHEDMAAASGGLVFINGLGAVSGPLVTGWLMDRDVIGPQAYFLVMLVLLALISAYAGYRSTRRASVPVDETGPYAAVSPAATAYAMEVAQEYAIDTEREGQEDPETSRNVTAGRNL